MSDRAGERPRRAADEERVADIILPHQTNGFGTMFGGDLMALMDKAAAIAALRFCRQPVVTASTERLDFRTPISQGEIVEASAKVIYVGRTSMVVRVRVFAEHPLRGDRRVCTTGYFSMVAISRDGGRPHAVPELLLPDEDARAEQAVGAEIHQSIADRRNK
ncbi:acyl-CoA thioesterase [Oscillochloris sp. ZM17-4]|uniref:acyl-CoA thioesterase n=1 Tax=Oscillochloris sp. ZM17-4 TaxID=2866714 RepID=UPI001C72FF30|nr:acyl-CoA thioesterase [Oscillochloris sp. ZM17-4]MBX0331114.1 acyl-CoA thioesterase [Oscillochloris sp. ZM17-4]